MSITHIEIVLELDATDYPSGTAAAAGREPLRFHGWLELVSTIGALSRLSADEDLSAPTPSIQGDLR